MQKSKYSVYRCERVQGQPRRCYVGALADPVTRILVEADDLARATRNASATAAAAELDMYETLEPALRMLSTEVSRLVRQARYRRRRLEERGATNKGQDEERPCDR